MWRCGFGSVQRAGPRRTSSSTSWCSRIKAIGDPGEAPIAEKYQARLNPTKVPPLLKEARDTARVIVAEFPSYEQAKACYEDPPYQEAKRFALKASKRDLLIFEGDLP